MSIAPSPWVRVDGQALVTVEELAQEGHQHEDGEGVGRGDLEAALELPAMVPDDRLGLLDLFENAQRPLVEQRSRLGEGLRARGPVEEADAQALLETRQSPAHAGGSNGEGAGGAREAARPDDFGEDLDFPETVHPCPRAAPSPWARA